MPFIGSGTKQNGSLNGGIPHYAPCFSCAPGEQRPSLGTMGVGLRRARGRGSRP